jgi:hypothetical protein
LALAIPHSVVRAQPNLPAPASAAFCLFVFPADGEKRAWLNLGIVQYIELRPFELRIYYGGGNLGSGHEVRVPIAGADEGLAIMQRMQAAAAACTRG